MSLKDDIRDMRMDPPGGYGEDDQDRFQDKEDDKECPECEGAGFFEDLSDCCGDTRDTDTMLCHYCHDHCGPTKCEDCNGTGIKTL